MLSKFWGEKKKGIQNYSIYPHWIVLMNTMWVTMPITCCMSWSLSMLFSHGHFQQKDWMWKRCKDSHFSFRWVIDVAFINSKAQKRGEEGGGGHGELKGHVHNVAEIPILIESTWTLWLNQSEVSTPLSLKMYQSNIDLVHLWLTCRAQAIVVLCARHGHQSKYLNVLWCGAVTIPQKINPEQFQQYEYVGSKCSSMDGSDLELGHTKLTISRHKHW